MNQMPLTRESLRTIRINSNKKNRPVRILSDSIEMLVYPQSVTERPQETIFIGRYGGNRFLGIFSAPGSDLMKDSDGTFLEGLDTRQERLKLCSLSRENSQIIRELFEFARPRCIGIENSFGLGDRLGIAGPAHLRAVQNSGFIPVLAQQSIRELDRTERQPHEVMDAAVWSVIQEGYRGPWGADGDHLKTTDDIDRVMSEGFTMLTIDPGEFVDNSADGKDFHELKHQALALPWGELQSTLDTCRNRYRNQAFQVGESLILSPSDEDIYRAICKYGRVVAHTRKLASHIQEKYPNRQTEIELSIDETDSVTSAFEHFFISSELKRLKIRIVSLAPRFIGSFEKGIDYKGNLEDFRRCYLDHLAIAEHLGPYKIGLHSGSDKFSIYREIANSRKGTVHIKTAGTSYLEALKTIAVTSPLIFREIFQYSMESYPRAKSSYHVSASTDRVPPTEEMTSSEIVELIENNDDLRQILHVSFGGVLTVRDESGDYRFRDRLLCNLDQNEDVHFANLEKHLGRHLAPFTGS